MSVTVGICAFNEGLNIGSLLSNVLYEQGLPSGSEVLVVCSGCTDNTVEVVKRYAKKDLRVKIYVEEERMGKASAINIVLKNAIGDEILFVQADIIPGKGCLTKLITKIQNPNIGLVCARPQPINGSNKLPNKLGRVLWSLHDRVFNQFNANGQARHASEVYCVRKDIINRIPNETVNDDAYIAIAAKTKGWQICYEPESYVSIYTPETMSDYIKQRHRVIYGHHQIKKMTGENPQYFMSLLLLNRNAKKNLLFLFLSKIDLPTLIAFVWIEAMLNAISLTDLARGKSYRIWSPAKSTKRGWKGNYPSIKLNINQ